ncbi:hypothetical protein GY45DRAFT_1318867 [Cubamyces sp. BRFM 1775]|nr:hypothetical protein GY45DRAFT_1318867 [Cubamyces sp. BRFM 1775]
MTNAVIRGLQLSVHGMSSLALISSSGANLSTALDLSNLRVIMRDENFTNALRQLGASECRRGSRSPAGAGTGVAASKGTLR